MPRYDHAQSSLSEMKPSRSPLYKPPGYVRSETHGRSQAYNTIYQSESPLILLGAIRHCQCNGFKAKYRISSIS